MIYRVRFKIGGGHVHCALFLAPAENQTFAKCGDFVVRKGEEFECLMRVMSGVSFTAESEEDGIAEAVKP